MLKKRVLSILICLSMILAMIAQPGVSYAADSIDNYYSNAKLLSAEGKYPEEPTGQVFAGWYQDAALTKRVRYETEFDASGGAYAKFVDEKVLSVAYQIGGTVTKNSAETKLRLLTSVDTLRFETVGFVVEVNGKVQRLQSSTVYETVYGYVKGDGNTAYTPGETFVSNVSKYFMTYEFTELKNGFFGTPIKVTPFWVTMDGTEVPGKARTIVIYNGLSDDQFNSASSNGTIWSAPSTEKVTETASVGSGAAELAYQAVRNEYESSQLLIHATSAISSFELYASDLNTEDGDTILAENIDVYVEKYIHDNGNHSYESGSVPDALIPMKAANTYGENTIVSGSNGGLWTTIYVPKDTPAGTYSGEFVLSINSAQELIKIPVSIEVMDYTLSDENTAKTVFSWRYDRVAPGELDGSLDMMKYYYEFFQDYHISLQTLPLGTLSGEEMVKTVDEYYDELTSYAILEKVGDVSSYLLEQEEAVKEQILALAAASTVERNLLDKAIFYFIDEPNLINDDSGDLDTAVLDETVQKIKDLNTILLECVNTISADTEGTYANFIQISGWENVIKEIPNIIPITELGWLIDNQGGDAEELLQLMNCICPLYSAFTEAQTEDLLNMCTSYGLDLWWYGSSMPISPSATYHISDTNLLSARSVSWMQNKYNIQGNLYWDAAAYTDENADYHNEYINVYEAPYRNTTSGNTWAAGDGFLTYPGEAYGLYGPIPSMRLMSIRDGMEEYEILKDVEEKYNEKKTSFGISDVDANMESLFFNSLYTDDMETVNADGDAGLDFANVRDNLLRMAVNLEKDNGLSYAMSGIDISYDWLKVGYSATFTCHVEEGSTLTIDDEVVTSGNEYTTGKLSGHTSVKIVITNSVGETATYIQYLGTKPSLLSTASETASEPVETTTTTEDTTKTVQTYNATENSESLHSFDSYADITGAGLCVSKLLGETKVNSDTTYITEGNGSWMIRPEGDYGTKNDYPWFRMRCTSANFGTSDFNSYKQVLMDVYNASDEVTSIKWSFTVKDSVGNYSIPEERVYRLAPNAWTTCAFDLTDDVYGYLFDLTDVKYMTVSFLDKKQDENDTTLAELYFDNLRGLLLDEERETTTLQYNFEEGVTFEELGEVYIFETGTDATEMKFSRVSYEGTALESEASKLGFGDYALVGDATGSVWPEFTVPFDTTYAAGKTLTFWIYVETDEEAATGKTFKMESYYQRGGTANNVLNGNCQFNKWVQVSIELGSDSDQLWFFVNLDNGNSESILGNSDVTVYMDNFKITEANDWGPIL